MPIEFHTDEAAVVHQLSWQGDPEPMVVTYGVQIDPVAIVTDAQAIADELGTAFSVNVKSLLPPTISLVHTEIEWQGSAPPTNRTLALSVSGAGPGTGNAVGLLPANSAYLFHKRSGLAGRRGRGRMFWPGVDETGVDNLGNVAAAYVSFFNTALANWLADISNGPLVDYMTILHSTSAAVPPSPVPVASTQVTSLTIDARIATQRRRLRS